MSDIQLAAAAYLFQHVCVLLFALLLQLPLGQHSTARKAAGVLFATVTLVIGPWIYSTPTQMNAFNLATLGCLAAFSILHWAFLQPAADQPPSVLQVWLSQFTHALEGTRKVHRRALAKEAAQKDAGQGCHCHATQLVHGRPSQAGSTHARWAEQQQQQQQQSLQQPKQQCHCLWQAGHPCAVQHPTGDTTLACKWALLSEAVAALVVVYIKYEVGLYLLCSLSYGMCSSSSSSLQAHQGINSTVQTLWAGQYTPYVIRCVFAFPAGMILSYHMDIIYCLVQLLVVLGSFVWPVLSSFAAQLPKNAFNSPLAAASVSELWGFRWHQFLRFYFEGLGYAAVDVVLGQWHWHQQQTDKAPVHGALRGGLRCVAAFLMSGLLHEYLTWAVFSVMTGQYLLFFMVNCAAVLWEQWAPAVHACYVLSNSSKKGGRHGPRRTGAKAVPGRVTRVWVLVLLFVLSPVFVEPYRAGGFFDQRAFHLLGNH